jgi:hypothetical protein
MGKGGVGSVIYLAWVVKGVKGAKEAKSSPESLCGKVLCRHNDVENAAGNLNFFNLDEISESIPLEVILNDLKRASVSRLLSHVLLQRLFL